MTARVRVVRRDTHQAVHAGLGLELAVSVVALDLERAGLDARFFTRVFVQHFGLVAVFVGVAHVHAHQHRGPVLAFGAAGAGVDLDECVEGIGFAGKKRLDLGLRHLRLQREQSLLCISDDRLVALAFAHLDQFGVVGDRLLKVADHGDALVEVLTLTHELLRLLGIVPDRRVFGLGVQFSEAAERTIPVKDASSAARWTASCRRRPTRLQRA